MARRIARAAELASGQPIELPRLPKDLLKMKTKIVPESAEQQELPHQDAVIAQSKAAEAYSSRKGPEKRLPLTLPQTFGDLNLRHLRLMPAKERARLEARYAAILGISGSDEAGLAPLTATERDRFAVLLKSVEVASKEPAKKVSAKKEPPFYKTLPERSDGFSRCAIVHRVGKACTTIAWVEALKPQGASRLANRVIKCLLEGVQPKGRYYSGTKTREGSVMRDILKQTPASPDKLGLMFVLWERKKFKTRSDSSRGVAKELQEVNRTERIFALAMNLPEAERLGKVMAMAWELYR